MKMQTTPRWTAILTVAALTVAGLQTGSPVYGEDNTSTVFNNGGSTNLGGSLVIGNTGASNTLLISNATIVSNTIGIIGNAVSANFNSGLITGPGSVWVNSSTGGQLSFQATLAIGVTGGVNSLVISNGGRVVSQLTTALGDVASTSTNNTLTVTGNGSVLSNLVRLTVGRFSSHNQATIRDGGTAYFGSHLFVGESSIAHSNTLLVTGANARVNGADFSSFFVSFGGRTNQVIISNGGAVSAYSSTIAGFGSKVLVTGPGSSYTNRGAFEMAGVSGQLIVSNGGLVHAESPSSGENYIGNGAGSINNSATVTGTGSTLSVSYSLFVGHDGSSNALHISDGATAIFKGLNLSTSNGLVVGRLAGSANNLVTVSGGTIVSTNATSRNIIDVRRGSLLFNGGSIITDNLFLTNGASSVFAFNSGTLQTKATRVSNTVAFVVGDGSGSATLHLLGGTHSFADGLSINSNATLKGTGTVQGNTTVYGTLAPGNSPGIIHFGNLTLASNSTFAVELNGTTAGSGYDQADVAGAVTISNGNLNLSLGFSPTTGNQFTIISNDLADAVSGTFAGLPEGSLISVSAGQMQTFSLSYLGGDGNDVVLTFLVPEPSSAALLAMGGLALLWRRRAKAS